LEAKKEIEMCFLGKKTHRNYIIIPTALKTAILENLSFRRKSQNLINLWNPISSYRIYNSPLPDPILSQSNPVRIRTPCTVRFILTLISFLLQVFLLVWNLITFLPQCIIHPNLKLNVLWGKKAVLCLCSLNGEQCKENIPNFYLTETYSGVELYKQLETLHHPYTFFTFK